MMVSNTFLFSISTTLACLQDVIPFLKQNLDKVCDSEMIIHLGDRIVKMVVEQEKSQVGYTCCHTVFAAG